jgi:hypothetical protein
VERAMKVQEVITRLVKKTTWTQAGEILGLCDRQMRRWKERYISSATTGFSVTALGGSPARNVRGVATVEAILRLCQEQYVDFNETPGVSTTARKPTQL